MKNKIFIFSLITGIFIASCSKNAGKGSLDEKYRELDKLKKEASALNSKIEALELEIAKLDTSRKDDVQEIVSAPMTAQTFKTYIEVQGRIDADQNVSLSTQVPGMITKINVKAGDEVSKGQILAETDASAVLNQIADLETSLSLAKQAFEKQSNLWKQNIGTEMQYLQAKTNKESLEKKLNTLNEQVRMSKIISPISGTVDAVNIKLAQVVSPGMPAINVVNFSNLKVKADVAETYAAKVKNGNPVMIYFPDINDSIIGRINYASRAISSLTRTFTVEILLPNDSKFHPNMVAKLKINDYVSSKPVFTIPVKFIQKSDNENFVLIEVNGIATKRVIKINKEYNGIAEIAEGIAEGDKLIVEGYDLINEGDKIIEKK